MLKVKINFGGNLKKQKFYSNYKSVFKNVNVVKNRENLSNNNKNDNSLQNKSVTAFEELNELVGLDNVKLFLKELRAYMYILKARQKEGLLSDSMVLHMIFKGNPGTGKTTVARIIANFFKEVGFLKSGHLVEVERADLVGEYIGHTAQKTREHIKKALGGILFIDEAYSLARGGNRDFGREAIDCLVKGMEDYKDEFILILAGYKREMDIFLRSNPGLRSRFPIHLEFPDYTLSEQLEIAKLMLKKKEYRLSLDAELKLERILKNNISLGYNCNGNARYIRNILERAIRHQAFRLYESGASLNKDNLLEITDEDIIEEDINNSYLINI